MRSVKVGWNQILGTEISTSFEPFYLPGTIFIVVIVITIVIHKMSFKSVASTFMSSIKTMAGTVIALGTAVPMVRIFINSEVNGADLMSMPMELATLVANSVGDACH
ncbi:L-lactate permease [Pseudalkalibacillus hwajinpoensis]|uniref:L-lactate permease n=1 Tax=Guptibacillus hwajinpoensis TaxID=208199 RepID=UPI00325BD5BA